ncbi:MAG: hypothetical protein A2X34_08290 [Elusimicrobia bacterium GWC2_51_8]|nr:MAG: hypothetical protein A2X33_02460 [Elusimicrobia bacterium GWA2_51_34]OGR59347.1 MAG: hypothetical protein A2X34_08290 [Elusimicrobia bacterium GWC2_51_8]OGR86976.1 MAG: hypothetical protein A2021_01430 [Elusimicrobia bacterium GWF2_52_66]HAF96572.1 hypothetical protein [Elusimicrobiota bacterium]HCE98202.1 hypothetical protein [Elusimicrobiota bacterium]
MKNINLRELKLVIAAKIRALRQVRRWTQVRFAGLLGLSQNRLSEIERGKGSFTAEQLFLVLKTFNLQLDYFMPGGSGQAPKIQNALARLGAKHLKEDSAAVPTERFKEAAETVVEALVAVRSPRQITAIAPVIINQIDNLNLNMLRLKLAEAGFERRLGWVLENTLEAARGELTSLRGEWRPKYRRAELLLRNLLASWRIAEAGELAEDILDRDILSPETLKQVKGVLPPLARKWGIITRIGTGDFAEALRGARGTD